MTWPVRRPIWRVVEILVFSAALLSLVWAVRRSIVDARFDPIRWRSNRSGEQDGPRARMVGDLIVNHLKRGMHRKDVRVLLGGPDAQSLADEANNTDTYDLGHIGFFGIDPSLLWIKYDKADRLMSTEMGET